MAKESHLEGQQMKGGEAEEKHMVFLHNIKVVLNHLKTEMDTARINRLEQSRMDMIVPRKICAFF